MMIKYKIIEKDTGKERVVECKRQYQKLKTFTDYSGDSFFSYRIHPIKGGAEDLPDSKYKIESTL